jgi:hypothetical protein
MGWNGIGIGWPNASASAAPPVPQESYNFYNCVAEEYNYSSQYPVGSFVPEHRVVIDNSVYGYITETIPPGPGGSNISNLSIGDVNNRCSDSTVTFSFELNIDGSVYYLDLDATNAGPIDFESTINELIISVNYSIYLTSDENPPITESGSATFTIPSYLVTAGQGLFNLGEEYIFEHEGYNVDSEVYDVTSISINSTLLGPFNTGWDENNKYLTEYGNVWTFYYPNNE